MSVKGPVSWQAHWRLPLRSKTSAVLSESIVIPSGRTTVATFACPVVYPTVSTRTACMIQTGGGVSPAGFPPPPPGKSDEQAAKRQVETTRTKLRGYRTGTSLVADLF